MAAPLEAKDDDDRDEREPEERPPSLAEKLRLLFDSLYPEVGGFETQSVWVAGELFFFDGKFNNYVKTRDLTKQEGLIFRHLLRLILLCEEFAALNPPELSPDEWQSELRELSQRLAASCREVDPASTEELIAQAHAADVVEGEAPAGSAADRPSV